MRFFRSEDTEYLPGVYKRRERRRDLCRAMFAACESFGDPLWGIPMEITGGNSPEATDRARSLARRFLMRGWVDMIEEGAGGHERQVALDEALAVLDLPESWTMPSELVYSLIATELGDNVYAAHAAHRPLHRVGFN